MTTDEALDILTTTLIYGIYHEGASDGHPLVDTDLIYIGGTRDPISRRMDYHRNQARQGASAPIHTYIREEVDDPIEDLDHEELPYDSEQAAINALGDVTLNVQCATPGNYYDWTRDKVETLINTIEEENLAAAQRALDANPNQVRNAALRLGLIEPRGYTRVDWEKWDHKLGTMPDAALAEKIGCSHAAVYQRRQKKDVEAHDARLTDRQVQEAWIRYHLDDATFEAVADEVDDASPDQVRRIIRRETYADLTLPSKAAIHAADAYNEAEDSFRRGEDGDSV